MSRVSIVLGLLFGDEGKGITTDHQVSKTNNIIAYNPIVVRFSGGQQAAHNVRIGDKTHVHSNFGSGTLRGVPSYFSEHTVINPLTMQTEYNVLKEKGVNPILYLHPKAIVSVPYDIVFNRIRERKKRHGSCGMGVGSAMVRNIETGYKLFAVDLINHEVFKTKINNIRQYYLSKISEEDRKYFIEYESEVIDEYMDAIKNLQFELKNYDFLREFDEIIFEGSQGILLDMEHGFFPNVTYAHTTSKNALEICEKLLIPEHWVDVYYVTRCYQTRHGNGWMSNENKIDLVNNQDEINVTNEWQGNFRTGEIDYDLINYAMNIDDIYSNRCNKNLVVTCLDQRPGFVFDYSKIKTKFRRIYESNSSDSKDFIKKHEDFNYWDTEKWDK